MTRIFYLAARTPQRIEAIAATVELFRDHILTSAQARLILAGLDATQETRDTLQHGHER